MNKWIKLWNHNVINVNAISWFGTVYFDNGERIIKDSKTERIPPQMLIISTVDGQDHPCWDEPSDFSEFLIREEIIIDFLGNPSPSTLILDVEAIAKT